MPATPESERTGQRPKQGDIGHSLPEHVAFAEERSARALSSATPSIKASEDLSELPICAQESIARAESYPLS